MATGGGTILLGVGEDEHRQLSKAEPVELKGLPEKIDQVLQTSLTPVPGYRIQTLPMDGDPSRGFVFIVVPKSHEAPHMVNAKGDCRYYGRAETGNRKLLEAEVDRLYAARVSLEANLERELLKLPEPVIPHRLRSLLPPDLQSHGTLQVLVRPLSCPLGWPVDLAIGEMKSALTDIYSQTLTARLHPPTHGSDTWNLHRPWEKSALGLSSEGVNLGYRRLTVGWEGSIQYGCTHIVSGSGHGPILRLDAVVQHTARVVYFAMKFFDVYEHLGSFDVGVVVRGIATAEPSWNGRPRRSAPTPYGDEFYVSARRDSAMAYDPARVAKAVTCRLVRATAGDQCPSYNELRFGD